MNIFLAYEDNINKSVEVLDDKRLIKQILECYQLLQILDKEKHTSQKLSGPGYHNHPIYKHYKQYENFLFLYGYTCCCEYEYRFDKRHRYFEYFECEINSSKRAENYNYIPFYMEGSKGQPNYVRTTENVSQLYQRKLVHKWLNTKGGCTWTNRKKPEFLMEVVRNGERMIQRASEDKDYFYEIIWEVEKNKNMKKKSSYNMDELMKNKEFKKLLRIIENTHPFYIECIAQQVFEKYKPVIPSDCMIITQQEYDALKQIESFHIASCGKSSIVVSAEELTRMFKDREQTYVDLCKRYNLTPSEDVCCASNGTWAGFTPLIDSDSTYVTYDEFIAED